MCHLLSATYCQSLFVFRFWRALRSFDQTDRAKFLQFVTGSSKVPLQVTIIVDNNNNNNYDNNNNKKCLCR